MLTDLFFIRRENIEYAKKIVYPLARGVFVVFIEEKHLHRIFLLKYVHLIVTTIR